MLPHESIEVTLVDGYRAQLSFISDLIMLHTPTTSAQWEPALTAIELSVFDRVLKVGFHSNNGSQTYQSWLFDATSTDAINTFFVQLGYRGLEADHHER